MPNVEQEQNAKRKTQHGAPSDCQRSANSKESTARFNTVAGVYFPSPVRDCNCIDLYLTTTRWLHPACCNVKQFYAAFIFFYFAARSSTMLYARHRLSAASGVWLIDFRTDGVPGVRLHIYAAATSSHQKTNFLVRYVSESPCRSVLPHPSP